MSATPNVGLEYFGRRCLQLGSPDRKKYKPNFQEYSFPQQSLYAPPQNPSSEHLIATNPFDDNPNTNRLRASRNQYLKSPGNSGFGVVGPPPPNMTLIVSSTTGCAYFQRNPAPQFVQNPTRMGFHRFNGLNSTFHNNPGFEKPPFYNGVLNKVRFPSYPFHRALAPNANNHQQNSWQSFNSARSYVPHHSSHVHTPAVQTNSSLHPERTYHLHNTHGPKYNSEANMKTTNLNYPPSFNYFEHEIDDNLNRPVQAVNDCESSNDECIGDSSANEKYTLNFQTGEDKGNSLSKLLPPSQTTHPFSDSVSLCRICKAKVEVFQDALRCEVSCHGWFHRTCTGMTQTAYTLLIAEASAAWGCDHCMVKAGSR